MCFFWLCMLPTALSSMCAIRKLFFFLISNIYLYHHESQSTQTHTHIHTYTDRHTHRCISTQNVPAHRCKKSMNCILTLRMYKTFCSLEKNTPHTIALRKCLLSWSFTDTKWDEQNPPTLAFTAFCFNLVKWMLHLQGFTVSVSLKKEKCLCSIAVKSAVASALRLCLDSTADKHPGMPGVPVLRHPNHGCVMLLLHGLITHLPTCGDEDVEEGDKAMVHFWVWFGYFLGSCSASIVLETLLMSTKITGNFLSKHLPQMFHMKVEVMERKTLTMFIWEKKCIYE